MDTTYNTYKKQILSHLKEGKSITQNESTRLFGCTRLSAVIFELIRDGWNITSSWEYGENRNANRSHWKRYFLKK